MNSRYWSSVWVLCALCGLAFVPPAFAADDGYGQVLLDPLGLPYYLDAQGRPFRVDENGRPYRFRAGGGIEYLDPRGRPLGDAQAAGSDAPPDAAPDSAADVTEPTVAETPPAPAGVAPETAATPAEPQPAAPALSPPAPPTVASPDPEPAPPDSIVSPAATPPPAAAATAPASALPEVEVRRVPQSAGLPPAAGPTPRAGDAGAQAPGEVPEGAAADRTDMNLTALESSASIAPSALREEPASDAPEPQQAREPTDLERFLSGEADIDWGERALRRFEPDTRLSRTEAAIDAAGLREAAHASTIRQRLGRLRGEQEQLMQQAQAELLRNGHTTRRFDDIADRLDALRREIDELDRKLDELAP